MVVCPRTGRAWPDEYRSALRTCSLCQGLIDVRHEAWRDHGGRPMHSRDCPPQRSVSTSSAPAPATSAVRLTGKEMIAAWEGRLNRVHEAAMALAEKRRN